MVKEEKTICGKRKLLKRNKFRGKMVCLKKIDFITFFMYFITGQMPIHWIKKYKSGRNAKQKKMVEKKWTQNSCEKEFFDQKPDPLVYKMSKR